MDVQGSGSAGGSTSSLDMIQSTTSAGPRTSIGPRQLKSKIVPEDSITHERRNKRPCKDNYLSDEDDVQKLFFPKAHKPISKKSKTGKGKDFQTSLQYKSLPNGKPLISENLRRDLENLIEKYKSKASSLRNLGSTQANESFNHSVATKAPKSKHYGGSQSLASRVSSAVLQKNEGYNYLEQMNEAALLSPGEYTKSIAKKLDTEKLKRRIKRQVVSSRKKELN